MPRALQLPPPRGSSASRPCRSLCAPQRWREGLLSPTAALSVCSLAVAAIPAALSRRRRADDVVGPSRPRRAFSPLSSTSFLRPRPLGSRLTMTAATEQTKSAAPPVAVKRCGGGALCPLGEVMLFSPTSACRCVWGSTGTCATLRRRTLPASPRPFFGDFLLFLLLLFFALFYGSSWGGDSFYYLLLLPKIITEWLCYHR